VKLIISTKSERGVPISVNVGIQVVNDSVLEMIERRKHSPSLPAMALLEPEVDRIDDSEKMLENSTAVDLLLGTQGWRRFAFANKNEFLLWHSIKGEQVLGFHEPLVSFTC
jgi:hypothetical protein